MQLADSAFALKTRARQLCFAVQTIIFNINEHSFLDGLDSLEYSCPLLKK
jgi:hypothetical protein